MNGRLLPLLKTSGPKQMALDELLLESSLENSSNSPTLRFYQWEGNWLSIGRNQLQWPKSWAKLAKSEAFNIVRRPSGGGGVLHIGGLTYSLVWPGAPKKRKEAYYQTTSWLIKSFAELGFPLRFGTESLSPINRDCFQTSTIADLIDPNGQKRVGSAQFWRKGYLLQHGEILLDPPTKLWREVFNSCAPEPAPSSIPRKGLQEFLLMGLNTSWPEINWQESDLTKDEKEKLSFNSSKYIVPLN